MVVVIGVEGVRELMMSWIQCMSCAVVCCRYNFFLNGVYQFTVDAPLNTWALTNVTSSVRGVWTCEAVNGGNETSPMSPPRLVDVSGMRELGGIVGGCDCIGGRLDFDKWWICLRIWEVVVLQIVWLLSVERV